MYDVGDVLPVDSLPSGVFIVTGDGSGALYPLVRAVIERGVALDEGTILVSADRGVAAVRRDIAPLSVGEDVRVLDCTAKGTEPEGLPGVSYVSSPGDLTGIGMHLNRHLQAVGEGPVRVGINSLSTLLMYSEYRRVFRFVHVMANRLRAQNALGLLVLHQGSHSDVAVSNLLSTVDGTIEVRTEDGGTSVRVRRETESTAWTRLELQERA